MNAVAVVSIYVVTNRASYLKCDVSVSVYRLVSDNHCQKPLISGAFLFYVSPPHTLFWIVIWLNIRL